MKTQKQKDVITLMHGYNNHNLWQKNEIITKISHQNIQYLLDYWLYVTP